jgi:UDP-2,3-diacylglucosamine pyrophosphatase LpxH
MAYLDYRTIWLSDIHLGTRGCQADMLLDFLAHTKSETLYLVGDIFDGWELKKKWFWPKSHQAIIHHFLGLSRSGTQVVYIPGNHDEIARDYLDKTFSGIPVTNQLIHTTAKGQRFLVMHGDQFDAVMGCAKWLAKLGSMAYGVALVINWIFNRMRRLLGFPYWSLSAFLKQKVKGAVKHINDYEHFLVQEARRNQCVGIVCGHIHRAEIRSIEDILYCNDGDWVESCTALVEHHDGRMEIIDWPKMRAALLSNMVPSTQMIGLDL